MSRPRLFAEPGRQFGRLTALSETRNPRGVRAVLCRCACGRLTVATLYSLLDGSVVSCGCLKRERLAEQNRSAAGRERSARLNRERGGHGRRIAQEAAAHA
jgi:hypothetical protein